MRWLPGKWIPKAIAIDIDGTITDENKLLNTEAITALRKLEQAGIPVILCTGNVRAIVYGLWRFIGLSGPIVCENGGVVWHPNINNPLLRANGQKAKDAAYWLADQIKGLDPSGITTNSWRESEWCLKTTEDIDAIKREINSSQWRGLNVVKTGFAIHLMEPHITKGEGLKIALEMLNLNPNDVLAIGDAPNDLSMFELVKWSIAVGGSFDSVKKAANVISKLAHGKTIPPVIEYILSKIN